MNKPDVESIQFSTSMVTALNGIENIAKDLDEAVFTKKYQKHQELMAEVDAATEAAVKKGLNGYQWSFYARPSSYKIEFSDPNNFAISSGLGLKNTGTYTVHAGCIVLYYPSNKKEIVVEYARGADGSPEFDASGSIKLPKLADQFVVDPDYDGRE